MEPGKEGNREAGWGDISLPSASYGACGSRASLEKAELHASSPSLGLRRGVRGPWEDNACVCGKEGMGAAALALPSFKLVRRGSW